MDEFVFVENRNDFTHVDKCAGVEFVFPPGEPVRLTRTQAQHFFGYGSADKASRLARLGWQNDPDGVKKLAAFVFSGAEIKPGTFLHEESGLTLNEGDFAIQADELKARLPAAEKASMDAHKASLGRRGAGRPARLNPRTDAA